MIGLESTTLLTDSHLFARKEGWFLVGDLNLERVDVPAVAEDAADDLLSGVELLFPVLRVVPGRVHASLFDKFILINLLHLDDRHDDDLRLRKSLFTCRGFAYCK